jgi:hypothetical protein
VTALLPLIVWMLVQIIDGHGPKSSSDPSRELFFFAVTMCTLSISGLRNVPEARRVVGGYESLFQASVLGAVASGALYGVFLAVHDRGTELNTIFTLSIVVAAVSLVIGTLSQIFVSRSSDS